MMGQRVRLYSTSDSHTKHCTAAFTGICDCQTWRDALWARLMKMWPRCTPYDTRKRLCLRHKEWNGRCRIHLQKATDLGEQL